MKQELRNHLIPLGVIFIIVSAFWLFRQVAWFEFVFLLFGFFWGAFFLDLDHLIYWFYLNPNIEESRLARIAFDKRDFRSLLKLLESTHYKHTSMVFHHYFTQVVLGLISIFIFTSSSSTFAKAFILATNLHLLVDGIKDFRSDPTHLQEWLFARESKQLPISALKYYLGTFVVLILVFSIFLAYSKP